MIAKSSDTQAILSNLKYDTKIKEIKNRLSQIDILLCELSDLVAKEKSCHGILKQKVEECQSLKRQNVKMVNQLAQLDSHNESTLATKDVELRKQLIALSDPKSAGSKSGQIFQKLKSMCDQHLQGVISGTDTCKSTTNDDFE